MIEGVLLPVIIEGLTTRKDGSVSVKLETQELKPNQAAELFQLRGKYGFAYLSGRDVEANTKKIIDSLDPELKGKTPGQRLRNTLFVYWEQSGKEGDFEDFYKKKMEGIISLIKQELNP